MDKEFKINNVIGKPNRNRKLRKAFGKDRNGLVALPRKVSKVKVSRNRNAEEHGECTRCFPHGFETDNATVKKNKRNWKNQRKEQWL